MAQSPPPESRPAASPHQFDVVVYGATEAGVMAAVAAARSGASVGIVARGRFMGGLLAGGRSYLEEEVRPRTGGLARGLFERIGAHYGEEIVWAAEPHVVEGYFRQMLTDAGVEIFREEVLREVNSVRRKNRSIRRIITDRGEVFEAAVYIDASYEGDLMAAAGVPFGLPGEAAADHEDNHSFVICGTRSPDRVPIPKPPDYSAVRYAPWLELIAAVTEANNRPAELADLVRLTPLPDGKLAATIANGSTGTPYLEADLGGRATIWQSHINYTTGLYYFLANDPDVPEPMREEFQGFGLCDDEFLFTNRWPHQLRIRAGRRMVGEYSLTWEDAGAAQPDSIATASFRGQLVQVPYRVLLPPAKKIRNLLVPGCPSAGETITKELRRPVTAMALGHAAGLAAHLALEAAAPVREIDTAELIGALRRQGAVRE